VVTFTQTAERKGAVDYQLVVQPPAGVHESRADDNQQSRTINVFDEPLKVLVVAGGPMRDYIFAKNALHRHNSMQIDVWLQTGGPGISQDAHEILFGFPKTREELFAYDVIVAFDPDWSQIPADSQKLLEDWVAAEGGGLILIAGDVNTSELAAAISDSEAGTEHLANLYPVLLEEVRGLGAGKRASESFPIGLTQEGTAAAFLKLEDQPTDADVWEQLRVYRCYPTRGRKRGATVYAEFTDPQARGRDGQAVLLAGQRYSQGNILYLGSPEIWRLRAVDESFYDRFWIKLVRKAGEGRTRRGVQGSMLIMEGREYDVGQTVPIRAKLLNSQFQPLDEAQVAMQVTDPTGRPLVPPLLLVRDPNRPAEYTGDFLAAVPGRYKLELTVPDTRNALTGDVTVLLPRWRWPNSGRTSRSSPNWRRRRRRTSCRSTRLTDSGPAPQHGPADHHRPAVARALGPSMGAVPAGRPARRRMADAQTAQAGVSTFDPRGVARPSKRGRGRPGNTLSNAKRRAGGCSRRQINSLTSPDHGEAQQSAAARSIPPPPQLPIPASPASATRRGTRCDPPAPASANSLDAITPSPVHSPAPRDAPEGMHPSVPPGR
jgi:hypothetical protein